MKNKKASLRKVAKRPIFINAGEFIYIYIPFVFLSFPRFVV